MTASAYKFAVLGAGSWGTALANLLAQNGHQTILWGRKESAMQSIQSTRHNSRFFADKYPLADKLEATSDLDYALSKSNILLLVTPCAVFNDMLKSCSAFLKENPRLVWACKGLDKQTGELLSQSAREQLGADIQLAYISGPNFAAEVMAGLPTATTVAGTDTQFAGEIAQCLHNDWFRAYSIDDIVSAQIGGALKNVYAIAAGICDGMGFGSNARAALLTRSMAELIRLGKHMNGQPETFMGMTGMGDLVLTCTDDKSRNRQFGLLMAEGLKPEQAIESIGQAVEGVNTTKMAFELANSTNVDMPILQQVYQVIYEGLDPKIAVKNLLGRDQKAE